MVFLLAQKCVLHSCVSLLAPEQDSQPSTGGGLLHNLKRCRRPPPQLAVHTVHQDQSDHSAGGGSGKNKDNCSQRHTIVKSLNVSTGFLTIDVFHEKNSMIKI